MSDLNNSYVYIFPAANRTNSLTSSLTTEYNLVKMVTRLTSQESFVISDALVEAGFFEFCLKGYYIRVPYDQLKQELSSNGTLYATLATTGAEPNTTNGLGPQVEVPANGAYFTPLDFSTTPSVGALALLTRSGNTYSIPEGSTIRMVTDAGHRYVAIDDGDLDAT